MGRRRIFQTIGRFRRDLERLRTMIEPTQESEEEQEVFITKEVRTPNRDRESTAKAKNPVTQGTPSTVNAPNPNETIDIADSTVEISASMELEERSSQASSPETMMSISGSSSPEPEIEILNESQTLNVTPAIFTSEDVRTRPGYSPPTQRTPRESTRAKPLVGSPLTDVDKLLGRSKQWTNTSSTSNVVEVTNFYVRKLDEAQRLKEKLKSLRMKFKYNKVNCTLNVEVFNKGRH